MHAVLRETTYRTGKAIQETQEFREFQEAHESLEGYIGTVIFASGPGTYHTLTLWQTAGHMHAAREKMGPVVETTVNPLMAGPPVLLGTGPVVVNDLVHEEPAGE